MAMTDWEQKLAEVKWQAFVNGFTELAEYLADTKIIETEYWYYLENTKYLYWSENKVSDCLDQWIEDDIVLWDDAGFVIWDDELVRLYDKTLKKLERQQRDLGRIIVRQARLCGMKSYSIDPNELKFRRN